MDEEITNDEIAGAILEMYYVLCLMYQMDGYKSEDPRLEHLEPMRVPFAENVDRAVERFDRPALRQKLSTLLYPKKEESD